MTSANPPYPYYNGIAYNSAYFITSNGSGLTQAKANTLYLQKTTPDTATAVETFSSGITTNTINTTGVGSTLNMGESITTGSVNIGNQQTSGNI